jgi:hypothetical protein
MPSSTTSSQLSITARTPAWSLGSAFAKGICIPYALVRSTMPARSSGQSFASEAASRTAYSP